MTHTPTRPSTVTATALEVLPSFGIAYFVDDHDMAWAVTKSTQGQVCTVCSPASVFG